HLFRLSRRPHHPGAPPPGAVGREPGGDPPLSGRGALDRGRGRRRAGPPLDRRSPRGTGRDPPPRSGRRLGGGRRLHPGRRAAQRRHSGGRRTRRLEAPAAGSVLGPAGAPAAIAAARPRLARRAPADVPPRPSGAAVFLDEVGDMAPETQAKVLRVLENPVLYRVGGRAPVQVDVRFVAATNRDLEILVEEGGFRRDLYHRLAAFEVKLPPLRARR